MPVHRELRPEVLQAYWETANTPPEILAPYWPATPSRGTDEIVRVEQIAFTRERGRINTRYAQPNVEEPYSRNVANVVAESWRDAISVPPEVFDMREPGQATGMVPANESERAVHQLRNRWGNLMEWLRAQAFQGVKQYYPPGIDSAYSELLLCSDDCLIPEVVTGWDTAPATEAIARATLLAIMADFRTAMDAMAAVGTNCSHVLMNATTVGYIEDNAIMAGQGTLFEYISGQLATSRHMASFMGLTILIHNETYVHPILGTTLNFIPNNVAVFFDSNNTRAMRAMIECRPVGGDERGNPPPMTARGLWWPATYTEGNTPKTLYIPAEWHGQPVVGITCGQYVYQDVTAEIQL